MGKIKISKGGSVLSDIGKHLAPVAKELLPVAKELGVALLKKKAGLGIPIHLAKHHITKLRKGGAISISPAMIKEGASHIVHMLPEKAQNLVEAIKSSTPYKYAMAHGEKLLKKGGEVEIVKIDRDDGESDEEKGGKLNFKGVIGDIGRTLKPVAKELAPVATDIAKEVGVALLKKKAGLGIRRRHYDTHEEFSHHTAHHPNAAHIGSPYHHRHHGMGLYPAGGGLYPAGLHGGAIQLGSPYVSVYSPAFHPYFSNHNPYHQTSPIHGGKINAKDVFHGISQGLQTVAPLRPLMLL
jgi:hypothetical protein